jgi:hypothetical protein
MEVMLTIEMLRAAEEDGVEEEDWQASEEVLLG